MKKKMRHAKTMKKAWLMLKLIPDIKKSTAIIVKGTM